ncbi:hypothetical protein C4D60_Mb04t20830 [Musa balbisiana]|uniref:Uncharacterized protein n=1 Tax=Musa balbisiana TaxID=52838 RepID=A0A4S8KDK7_MUSBA|nr:hypothetical protein C4D60_Mb04t20830 [Musa balbisiana]
MSGHGGLKRTIVGVCGLRFLRLVHELGLSLNNNDGDGRRSGVFHPLPLLVLRLRMRTLIHFKFASSYMIKKVIKDGDTPSVSNSPETLFPLPNFND